MRFFEFKIWQKRFLDTIQVYPAVIFQLQIDKFVADKYADHTDIFLSAQTLEELEFKHYFSEKSLNY